LTVFYLTEDLEPENNKISISRDKLFVLVLEETFNQDQVGAEEDGIFFGDFDVI
jgi:hypothetical protein